MARNGELHRGKQTMDTLNTVHQIFNWLKCRRYFAKGWQTCLPYSVKNTD